MEQNNDFRHWHLDKRVNVGHLITTLVLAAGIFTWASNMESRVAVLTNELESVKASNANDQDALRREMSYLRGSVDRLNDKIDRLIERDK